MRADAFRDSDFGFATRKPGDRWSFVYYQPRHIPRELVLHSSTVTALAEASTELGRLDGLGQLVNDPGMLIGPFLTREALASSRIEGTNASLSEVLQAEAIHGTAPEREDVREVSNYLAATRLGMRLIEDLPITQRMIKDLHARLLQGVRGEERMPGELRRSPVWVGGERDNPDTSRFVPPLPEHLGDLLDDWERYVNEPPPAPILVRCALMHYQFETIHPFLDGNGRIGRVLVGMMLARENALRQPLLYLSGYLESNRDEYYNRLQGVRERADINGYLMFFLQATSAAARDAGKRASLLVSLRERFYAQSRLDRSRVTGLIPLVFETPFLSTRRIESALRVTAQGARGLIHRAESYGWLKPAGSIGRGGMSLFVCEPVLEIVEAPSDYDQLTAVASGAPTTSTSRMQSGPPPLGPARAQPR